MAQKRQMSLMLSRDERIAQAEKSEPAQQSREGGKSPKWEGINLWQKVSQPIRSIKTFKTYAKDKGPLMSILNS